MPPAFPCCRRTDECNRLSWSLPVRCLHKQQKQPLPLPFRGHSCWFLCAALLDAEARGPLHVPESQTPRGQPVRVGSQSFLVNIALARDRSRPNTQVEFHGSKGIPSAAACGRTGPRRKRILCCGGICNRNQARCPGGAGSALRGIALAWPGRR